MTGEQFLKQQTNGAVRTPKWVLCGCYAAVVLLLVATGVLYQCAGAHVLQALFVWLLACLALVPGHGLLYKVAPKLPLAQQMAGGMVLSMLFFSAVTLGASASGVHVLVRLYLLGAAGLLAWILCKKRACITKPLSFLQTVDGAFLCVACALAVLMNAFWSVRYASPIAVGTMNASQDYYWNLGNVKSFLLGFPLADLRIDGVTVQYHFLTELYQAGLCMASGLSADALVAFYTYAPLVGMMLCVSYALGYEMWGKQAARQEPDACRVAWLQQLRPSCARALALATMPFWLVCVSLWKAQDGASRFGNGLFLQVISNINGQVTALLAIAAFFLFLFALFAQNEHTRLHVLLCVGSFALLTFAKSPQAGLLAIALACAGVVHGIASRANRKKTLVMFAIAAAFLCLYQNWFVAGASSSMKFSLVGSLNSGYFASILAALQIRFAGNWQLFLPLLMALQALLMMPAVVGAWVCIALCDCKRLLQQSALKLVLHAATVGGFVAYFIFTHYSSSQAYFAYLALYTAGLLVLESLPQLFGLLRGSFGKLLKICWLVVLLASMLTLLIQSASVVRQALQYFDEPVCKEGVWALTAGEAEGCQWLAENMPEDALFATNRMHSSDAQEGLSNIYTGLSGRRAYMESFKYAVSNMGENAGDVMSKYAQVNTLFSAQTTEEELRAICESTNISYLLYTPLASGDCAQLDCFPVVYQNETITIYYTG